MKFKIFIGLVALVLGTFLFVLCKPEPADAELNQVKKIELREMKGLGWDAKQEKNLLDRFEETEVLILHLFKNGRFGRIGHILEKFGTVITKETGEAITGKKDIADEFGLNSGKTLSFKNVLVAEGGVIEKRVGGQKIDKWALVVFEIHFTDSGTLQNQTHGGRSLLLHRNDCPWDG